MKHLALGAVFALASSASASAAVGKSLGGGYQAEQALGAGLSGGGGLESLSQSGFDAQQLLQGLDTGGDKSAVDARAAQAAQEADKAALRTRGLVVNEPPAPGKGILPDPNRAGDQPPQEAPKKRDWMKIITKWLPIGMFYWASINAILNPLGAAALGIQGIAVYALIGTAMMLYKEIKNKA
ncbi:MAG: hypothetical protein AAB339_07210 [Elusimicrobiota bacterium]